MKKFTAIIIVLFLVISLTACSSTSYRYADNWSIEVGQTIDDPVAVIEKYVKPDASKFDEMLKDTKKLVKESVPYPELHLKFHILSLILWQSMIKILAAATFYHSSILSMWSKNISRQKRQDSCLFSDSQKNQEAVWNR